MFGKFKLSNDVKGEIFQSVIYDYYEFYGYEPYIISSDARGRQRFASRNDITMPDLLVFDNTGTLFFVECKSNYKQERHAKFSIGVELEESYKKFFREVFPSEFKNSVYEYSIPTTIAFGKWVETSEKDGFFKCWFMEMIQLGNTKKYKMIGEYNKKYAVYRQDGISGNSYFEQDITAKSIGDGLFENEFFYGDILSKDRNHLIFENKSKFVSYLRHHINY